MRELAPRTGFLTQRTGFLARNCATLREGLADVFGFSVYFEPKTEFPTNSNQVGLNAFKIPCFFAGKAAAGLATWTCTSQAAAAGLATWTCTSQAAAAGLATWTCTSQAAAVGVATWTRTSQAAAVGVATWTCASQAAAVGVATWTCASQVVVVHGTYQQRLFSSSSRTSLSSESELSPIIRRQQTS